MFGIFKTISLDTWFAIGAATISFLLGLTITFIRQIKHKKCKNIYFCQGSSKDFTKLHSQINEILTEIRLELDSARAYICQFHNGGDFFSGESILKFSITHESCALGVEQTIDQQQGVLLTRFIEKLKILQEDQPRLIFTNTLEDSHFKGFMESRNTIAFILVPLRKQNMLSPYAYLCCEWCSWQHADKIKQVNVFKTLEKEKRILNTLLLTGSLNGKN